MLRDTIYLIFVISTMCSFNQSIADQEISNYSDFGLVRIINFECSLQTDFDIYSIKPSILQIKVYHRNTEQRSLEKFGVLSNVSTGIVINKLGHILTTSHVLSSATNEIITVSPWGSRSEYNATIVRSSEELDLVILEVKMPGLKPLKVASRSTDILAKEVMMIGFSTLKSIENVEEPHLSSGRVSCVERKIIESYQTNQNLNFLEVQGWADSGFSGGPVLNMDGKLVGVITLKVQRNNIWAGYLLALPIEQVIKFIQQ